MKERLRGADKADKGPKLRTLPRLAKEDDFWPALRRMGKLDKTRKGRLGKDCEE